MAKSNRTLADLTDLSERLAYVVHEWEDSHAQHYDLYVAGLGNIPQKDDHDCQLCRDSRLVLADCPPEMRFWEAEE